MISASRKALAEIGPHRRVAGPLLDELVVVVAGGLEQLLPQLFHAGLVQQDVFADRGVVAIDGRAGQLEVFLGLLFLFDGLSLLFFGLGFLSLRENPGGVRLLFLRDGLRLLLFRLGFLGLGIDSGSVGLLFFRDCHSLLLVGLGFLGLGEFLLLDSLCLLRVSIGPGHAFAFIGGGQQHGGGGQADHGDHHGRDDAGHQRAVPADPAAGLDGPRFGPGGDRLVGQPVFDVVRQGRGDCVAIGRLEGHGLEADRFQGAGHAAC